MCVFLKFSPSLTLTLSYEFSFELLEIVLFKSSEDTQSSNPNEKKKI